MLSRVADALYWMARNVERAENNARLLEVQLISQLENAGPPSTRDNPWRSLISINGNESAFRAQSPKYSDQSALDFLCFSELNPNSILSCVQTARSNARAIREIIPSELWELVNTYYQSVLQRKADHWEMDQIHSFSTMVKGQSLQFQGIMEAAMPHGDAYQFMQLGTYLERAQKTARILDVYYYHTRHPRVGAESIEQHHWMAVLQSVSAYEAYLRTYRAFVTPLKVGEYLIFDLTFPRSVRYCLDRVMGAFWELEHAKLEPYARDLYVSIGRLQSDLRYTRIEEISRSDVHRYLAGIAQRCNEVGRLLLKTYYLGEMYEV